MRDRAPKADEHGSAENKRVNPLEPHLHIVNSIQHCFRTVVPEAK
jgi:hypothetical protein